MGCNNSTVTPNEETSSGYKSSSTSVTVEWKVVLSATEARKKFVADGTLEQDCADYLVDLRMALDEHFTRQALGKFASSIKKLPALMFWLDVLEYKQIFSETYRYSSALDIFYTYIKVDTSTFLLDFISDQARFRISEDLQTIKGDTTLLTADFYDFLLQPALLYIHEHIYVPFKSSEQFLEFSRRLDKRYNRVKVRDFEYFRKLGEGGFGYVIHCRKISTGIHYAMKIQRKMDLIKSAGKNPDNVCIEKQAFAACQHPFIISLAYAFQTDSLAIMVLGLSTAGDLQQALNRSPETRFDEEHARFYMAEVVLAIEYLHQLGYIYRDLKPNNILLGEDGHILLLDLGGCAALQKLSATNASRNGSGLLDSVSVDRHKSADSSEILPYSNPVNTDKSLTGSSLSRNEKSVSAVEPRAYDVFGTLIYMAPEMIVMMHQNHRQKLGYTKVVDWWSLGVTLFKMVAGYRPFIEEDFSEFVEMNTQLQNNVVKNEDFTNYVKLFQTVAFPDHVSEDCRDFITKLLNVDEKKRLGAGRNGPANIKAHPFFKDIDWISLELKRIKAPAIPQNKYLPTLYDPAQHLTEDFPPMEFKEFLERNRDDDWLDSEVPQVLQSYFQDWDFTCDQCMRMEAGLSKVREQYDKNEKVRQLFGDTKEMATQKVTPSSRNNKQKENHVVVAAHT